MKEQQQKKGQSIVFDKTLYLMDKRKQQTGDRQPESSQKEK